MFSTKLPSVVAGFEICSSSFPPPFPGDLLILASLALDLVDCDFVAVGEFVGGVPSKQPLWLLLECGRFEHGVGVELLSSFKVKTSC